MHNSLLSALIALIGFFSVVSAPAFAAGSEDEASDSSAAYEEAKAMVDSANYVAALPALMAITQDDAKNADAWNLLGFTHRMLGQMDESSEAYLVVLSINPDHLGALEYQGELFLQTGQPDLAKANLAKLQGLCGTCEEFLDLEKALKAAGV